MSYAGKFNATFPAQGLGLHTQGYAHVETLTHHATHVPSDAVIVPDAQLLFNGEFKRSGVDLILSRDGHERVLQDYFKSEKRAPLSSPDGAYLTGDLVGALTGHTQFAQANGSVGTGKVIGHVTKLVGTATAIRNGVSIILHQGDNVEKGDVVQSGSDSTLGITFIDGSVFGLASNARMVLDEMVYDPNGSNNSSLISLVAGTVTFVAGETAKHGDMKIDTPVATMGIRGTACLVEIDFSISGQLSQPQAHFQVLVEPDGTTGSYILFDKKTLVPIATVNQAGQQINISQGQISITNVPLTSDVQKLITDVFSLKFTDATPKIPVHFTDTIIPQVLQPIVLANGMTAIPTIIGVKPAENFLLSESSLPTNPLQHIPGPPLVAAFNSTLVERVGVTGSSTIDGASSKVNFVDINAGDLPTVSTTFNSFIYRDLYGSDVTATLNTKQLADIAAVEVELVVVQAPGNKNNGSATWTYSVPDKDFDFLGADEALTLSYLARVDNNYAPNNEWTVKPFTITITGANDAPVIITAPQIINFSGGTSVPGGDLTTSDPTCGTLSFNDVDLTDMHTVSTRLTSAALSGSDVLLPGPLSIFETALSAMIATDSTGTGAGTVSWKLAGLPVYLADFISSGQVLTLTYTVTVMDSQNMTSEQNIVVTIVGADNPAVVWIATTTQGSPPGGLWNDASNWETGTVPTATDDVIITTDQLRGLTPSFPVTIAAPAFAKSLIVNDFEASSSELDNNSTLTIGGLLSLNAESILKNFGTISVGGFVEILNRSILQNSGFVALNQGGYFKDQGSIANTETGTIEVSGGVLNVLVDIANTGLVAVDSNARLTLNHAAIVGGKVINNGEIDLTGGGVLKNVSLANVGTIKVGGTDNALEGTNVTANSMLEIQAGGALLLDQGTTISNSGVIAINDAALLTMDHATIVGGTLTIKGTLNSTGTNVITDVDIINTGLIEVTGGELDLVHEAVTNAGALEAANGSLLLLSNTTVNNAGGAIKAGDSVQLTTSTIHLQNTTINDGIVATVSGGIIDAIGGTNVISGAIINNAGILELTGGTLIIDAASTVNNTGMIKVNGGSFIVDAALSGDATIIGASLLELGASFSTAYSTANIIFAEAATGTLKLDHAEAFHGTIFGFDDSILDLGDIAYGINTTVTYVGTATEGFLSIFESGIYVSDIHLSGNYLGAHWILTDDGSSLHGTKIAEAPGAITGLDSYGNAIEGRTVTALITDGGQAVTNVTYQWQLDGQDILNATGISYLPTEGDEGHALTVKISYLDAFNNAEIASASAGIVVEGLTDCDSSDNFSDNFVFDFNGIGHDAATDFHSAADLSQFSSRLFANVQATLSAMHDNDHVNTVVTLDTHDIITLADVLKMQLHTNDFFHVV